MSDINEICDIQSLILLLERIRRSEILTKFIEASTKGNFLEEVAKRCYIKKALLKLLQNSQENASVGVYVLIKLHT